MAPPAGGGPAGGWAHVSSSGPATDARPRAPSPGLAPGRGPGNPICHGRPYQGAKAPRQHSSDSRRRAMGPGAITAIVIAVFLGASVLLALIVITLRKFTAS
uniref:Secondary ossification center associated regulator of chondrocyte maturation n=1 Tax=Maylandia zebra TaxID=106582 RepID=A0A3P9DIN8_9CICH